MARSARSLSLSADAITVEGALIAPAVLARIATQPDNADTRADYRIPKGLTLRDEIARYFRIGQALFTELFAGPTPSTTRTIGFVEALFRDVFGFADVARTGLRTLEERPYAVTLEALGGRVPVVVVPPSDEKLDRASDHLPGDGHRRSAASAVQDWLNAFDGATWGFCCNGEQLRLLRDNASLTRPAYIEADLRQIFEAESFADFTSLWLLIHASRFGQPGTLRTDCALERWREAGSKEGATARDRLRDGVEAALAILGNGFLAANPDLRNRVQAQQGALTDFFGQLLRLVYRLIFLLAAEDRNLLHPPDASPAARLLYAQGYSLASLRDRAIRRTAWDAHHDKWEGLAIVFAALASGEPRLGLPALGGLFVPEMTPDLDAARLPNRALMKAIFRLAWLREGAALLPVNWRDMETEELGSVYESLLELTPQLTDDGRGFGFAEGGEARGHARKTTGSYYTPDALVQALLDSALDPVLDRVEAEADDPAAALLGVTVIDPACGSGHFLLAAGRRIATRLARARTGGVASAEDYRHALRDVARACLHGVDRNPMAVELTKVALWIETVEPGKPLGFLDANIRCGDALLGVFHMATLAAGVPDAAYKPLTGDDRATARYYAARNRDEQRGQGSFDFARDGGKLPAAPLAKAWAGLRAMPEDSPEQVAEKCRRFEAARADRLSFAWGEAADMYIAAFLLPKREQPPALGAAPMVPTSGDVWRALADKQVHPSLVARAVDASRAARAFHWPLEFPDMMAVGGFDVVLGNPPWERIKLQEQEFFAARDPEIAEAPNAATRGRMIAALAKAALDTVEHALHEDFVMAKRLAEAASVFVRESHRFPLTGRGDVNTYALFAELFARLAGAHGAAGAIVPTGISTDSTNAAFFQSLMDSRRIAALSSFENEEFIFPTVHHSFRFCLLSLSARKVHSPQFCFFLRQVSQMTDERRRFGLDVTDLERINPNTRTAPLFRSKFDSELTSKIYRSTSVLIDDSKGDAGNSWSISFMAMFHMANDSGLFETSEQLVARGYSHTGSCWVSPMGRYLPLYEGKLTWIYDHRASSYHLREGARGHRVLPPTSETDHRRADFEPQPFYWVDEQAVVQRIPSEFRSRRYLLGWRDITTAVSERTMIPCVVPFAACGDTFLLAFPQVNAELLAVLYSLWACVPFDYVARQKIPYVHLKYNVLKQLPVFPPSSFGAKEFAFVVPRVLELTYTSHAMAPFARDLSYDGPPFTWNEDRRALLRAELDAFYARAYGLTRDELRYILDPEDAMGPGYPSETFRVLKTNEIRRFGEYRTARLVLAAWDAAECDKHGRKAAC